MYGWSWCIIELFIQSSLLYLCIFIVSLFVYGIHSMDGAECIGGLFAVFVYFYCKCICVWVELSVSEGSLLSLLSCAKAKLLLHPKCFSKLISFKIWSVSDSATDDNVPARSLVRFCIHDFLLPLFCLHRPLPWVQLGDIPSCIFTGFVLVCLFAQ